jgi:hypothetical protein
LLFLLGLANLNCEDQNLNRDYKRRKHGSYINPGFGGMLGHINLVVRYADFLLCTKTHGVH